MEQLLSNGEIVTPNITKTIKKMISYFWQPSMDSRKYYYSTNQQSENRSPKKEIDKKDHLSLDNIMVLRVGSDETYMVSMLGLEQRNCDERILLSSGQKEMTVIEQCLKDNLELERKPIANYMPSDYIEIYNEALNIGRYDCCLTMLHGIEAHVNNLSKERNELKKTLKRGAR